MAGHTIPRQNQINSIDPGTPASMLAGMDFEELIETLSKGSATAVTTLESNVAELNVLKEYLYVQTPVEQALRAEIDRNLETPRVIFVCGSSGDGKSELFRRIHADYANKVRFHLDATHSFDPQKDAFPSRRKRQAVTFRQFVPTGALP